MASILWKCLLISIIAVLERSCALLPYSTFPTCDPSLPSKLDIPLGLWCGCGANTAHHPCKCDGLPIVSGSGQGGRGWQHGRCWKHRYCVVRLGQVFSVLRLYCVCIISATSLAPGKRKGGDTCNTLAVHFSILRRTPRGLAPVLPDK